MSILQAIIIGLVQGLTELFPISSLGHSIILPALLGWNIEQNNPYYLTFLVATHFATAVVLFGFFWRDWVLIFKGLGRSIRARRIPEGDDYARLGWLLVVGTVPAGLLGLALQKPLTRLFANSQVAAGFLIVNGIILWLAQHLKDSRPAGPARALRGDSQLAALGWRHALGVGLAQSAALVPGISRSGSSMAAGLAIGLDNETTARFSFLLATPVIGAASLLELPKLFAPAAHDIRLPIIAGAICAGVSAWLAVRFLMRFFRTNTLKPFAVYCVLGGLAYSVFFLVR